MTTRLLSTAVLTGLLLGAGGCQSTDPGPRPGLADPVPAPYNNPDISVVDEDLRQWLGFQPAVRVRTPGRPMHVEVPVRNLADQTYLIEYRYLFFDANGVQQQPEMGWRFAAIDAKQTINLVGQALDANAQTYRLQVRWSR
ncbi:MAG: DUF1425 domain-containing protein [Phycisphaeraceae bacterium]|nr:DUF1425 domain-containing protein [Phycisphaerales bacterium]QOJ17016.1 MAG: DUF1425 domain-containing protein [Phycisphaeraceae bacterium]